MKINKRVCNLIKKLLLNCKLIFSSISIIFHIILLQIKIGLGHNQLILIIRERATKEQLEEMLQAWGVFIKIVVDIERKILAGGAELHYECEQELLKDGSQQKYLWGADWCPYTQEIVFESIINIRPSQNNRTMIVESLIIREKITAITEQMLGEF